VWEKCGAGKAPACAALHNILRRVPHIYIITIGMALGGDAAAKENPLLKIHPRLNPAN